MVVSLPSKKVDSSGFQTEPVAADGKLLIQAKDGTVYSITLIVSVVHFENGSWTGPFSCF